MPTIRSIAALLIIAIAATSLALVSYGYGSYNSQRIVELATNEIRTSSNLKAHDISKIIENKFHEVTSVLTTLATSPAIQKGEIARGYDIINLRQDSTKDITDEMFWLDKDGKMQWSSKFAGNQSAYDKYKGADFSELPYFSEPKKTGTTYYSSIIETREAAKIYIAMPILDTQQATGINNNNGTDTVLKGIIGTGIKTSAIAEMVKTDIVQAFQSDVMLLDKRGTIIYSTNQSGIGQNVFSPEYRSYIYSLTTSEYKDALNAIVSDQAQLKSGSQDIKLQQIIYTISYSPITLGGNNFLMLYVLSPHTLTTQVNQLIEEQRNISSLITSFIGVVAVGIGILIISWNHRLHYAVEKKTAELRRANEQLLNNDKMQREFINIAAHELRTPIQPLLGVTELIKESMNSKDKGEITKEEVNILERNAKRLERLSSDILEVSRLESNSLKLNKEVVNLNKKIENVIADILPTIRDEQQVKIIFQPKNIEDEPIMVEADKTRLFEVISNLLQNALKFTKDGTILITLDKKDDQAIVSIKDTGKGIDQEILPRLFEKFATKSEQGTGLGLYISKGIIDAHNGRIWAENNIDGKGATFTFALPLMPGISTSEVNNKNNMRTTTT